MLKCFNNTYASYVRCYRIFKLRHQYTIVAGHGNKASGNVIHLLNCCCCCYCCYLCKCIVAVVVYVSIIVPVLFFTLVYHVKYFCIKSLHFERVQSQGLCAKVSGEPSSGEGIRPFCLYNEHTRIVFNKVFNAFSCQPAYHGCLFFLFFHSKLFTKINSI